MGDWSDEAWVAARKAAFWSRVEKSDGCWEWQGYRTSLGYGRFCIRPRTQDAHRWAWEFTHGALPPRGVELDHLCRNPPCVNPAHLEPVSHRENQVRGHGISGRARATHCQRGHEFTPENTAVRKGRRTCRACMRLKRGSRLDRASIVPMSRRTRLAEAARLRYARERGEA